MREDPVPFREPAAGAVHASSTDGVSSWLDRARSWALILVIGTMLAFVGAFGTDVAPLWRRLAFWLPTMAAGGFVGSLAGRALSTRRPKDSPLARWAMISLAAAAPLTVLVYGFTQLVFGLGAGASLLDFAVPVLGVSAAMTAIMLLVRPSTVLTQAPAAKGASLGIAELPQVKLLDRFPPKLRGGILYAVEAEDHYLRLRTSKGSDLILMRLSDAVAELEGMEGAQVHRSWWVARHGVAEVRRLDGKVLLILKDGGQTPVSRPNVARLRAAGWF